MPVRPKTAEASSREKPVANGVNRCPKCGASEVDFAQGWLTCGFCRFKWNSKAFKAGALADTDIAELEGLVVFEGAEDIDTSSLITLECSGCGALVGINSATTLQAQCHWCRHTLSLNAPVGNGAVPDAILPFVITKDDAMRRMWAYASAKAEFATAAFKKDFAAYAIHPVYLPYFVVDGSVTVRLDGVAWIQAGETRINKSTIYTTEQFEVMREVGLAVDDLTIEARSSRTRIYSAVSTSNIINAILPFDTANAVAFDAAYITDGVSFEARDMEIQAALSFAADHFATIARGYVQQTMTAYTGGVRWQAEQSAIKGTRWATMLLPVWLYGYQERTPRGPMMHYIAVNGRTGETQGSVPVDAPKAERAGWLIGLGIAALSIPIFILTFVIAIAGGGGGN